MPRESRTHLVWNRPYSGYDGSTTFKWEHQLDPETSSVASAVDAGIAYFVVTEEDIEQVYNSEAARNYNRAAMALKNISGR